jgi:hypothetical protein
MPVPEVVVDKCRIDCLSDRKVEPLQPYSPTPPDSNTTPGMNVTTVVG